MARGAAPGDGRSPRIDVAAADDLTLQIGAGELNKFDSAPGAAVVSESDADPQVEAAELDGNALFPADEDDDQTHFSKDMIALCMGATTGED